MSCFLVFTGVFHLKTPVESFVVLNDWMKRDKLHIVYEASRKTRANGGGFVFGYFSIFYCSLVFSAVFTYLPIVACSTSFNKENGLHLYS